MLGRVNLMLGGGLVVDEERSSLLEGVRIIIELLGQASFRFVS